MLNKLRYIPAALAAATFFVLIGLVYLSDGKQGVKDLLDNNGIEY